MLTCNLCSMWYTKIVRTEERRRVHMIYPMLGADVDDLIYGECEQIVSER